MSTPDFYSVPDAAKRYGVHPKLIYKEIAEGRLPAVKLGALDSRRPTIRIPREALERWERAQVGGSAQ